MLIALCLTGTFADENLVNIAFGLIRDDAGNSAPRTYGWLTGGDGKLLVAAITTIVVVFGWVLAHMVRPLPCTSWWRILYVFS